MKINKILPNHIYKTKNNNYKRNYSSKCQKDYVSIPSYAYRQYIVGFRGKEDDGNTLSSSKIEEKMSEDNISVEQEKNSIVKEMEEEFGLKIKVLSPEERENFSKQIIDALITQLQNKTLNVINIPEGLSPLEEVLYKNIAQLANLEYSMILFPSGVPIFSEAFATISFEPEVAVLPKNCRMFYTPEFIETIEKINIAENNKISQLIKSSFENKKEFTQELTMASLTAGKEPQKQISTESGEIIEIYSSSPYDTLYIEKSQNGELQRVLKTYKHLLTMQENPSLSYEFNQNGQLSKISKYNLDRELAAEIIIDNEQNKVYVLEQNSLKKIMEYSNGKFIEK